MINKIDATNLYSLLQQALQYSVENNLRVFTGTNLSAMKHFGCDLYDQDRNFDGKFKFSGYSHDSYFIPDPCHMIKLARNALADLCILTTTNKKIESKYICMFHDVQSGDGLKLANKLSRRHIEFQRSNKNEN